METFAQHKDLNKKYLESCIYQLLYTITQVCVKRRNVHLCLKKITDMGRKGPRAKTKTVLKSVSKWQQFGSMQNLKFQTFAK